MAWKFIPKALKVRLSADSLVIGKRVFHASRGKEDSYATVEEATIKTYNRRICEIKRYAERYGVNLGDVNNYDLVINTSFATPKKICNVIMTCAEYYLENKSFARLWRSPKTFYPTQKAAKWFNLSYLKTKMLIRRHGFLPNKPISSLSTEHLYYVFYGHDQIQAAIRLNVNLIPYTVYGQDNDKIKDKNSNILTVNEYIQKINPSDIKAFEKSNHFKYQTYPWLPKSELLQMLAKIKKESGVFEILDKLKSNLEDVI
jgi:hypothetical protein